MSARNIYQFYSDDHARLDRLFELFHQRKENDPGGALGFLEQFKAGLERHMAWEEAVLFPEYDAKAPTPKERVRR